MRLNLPDLRIGSKILVLLGSVVVPFGLMTYLYVAQASKDIAFADLERQGVTYIEALSPVLTALTEPGEGPVEPALIDSAGRAGAEFDPRFKSQEAVEALRRGCRRPGSAGWRWKRPRPRSRRSPTAPT